MCVIEISCSLCTCWCPIAEKYDWEPQCDSNCCNLIVEQVSTSVAEESSVIVVAGCGGKNTTAELHKSH